MNYYLKKYVGKYRVMTETDQTTNDFCKDKMVIIVMTMTSILNA